MGWAVRRIKMSLQWDLVGSWVWNTEVYISRNVFEWSRHIYLFQNALHASSARQCICVTHILCILCFLDMFTKISRGYTTTQEEHQRTIYRQVVCWYAWCWVWFSFSEVKKRLWVNPHPIYYLFTRPICLPSVNALSHN